MIYKNRQKFNTISEKTGKYFSRIGLSPNQWTLLALVPATIAAIFLVHGQFIFAALFLLLSASIDMIDGAVARLRQVSTPLGAYLDTITDRYSEAIVIFGLFFVQLPSLIVPYYVWIAAYLFGSMTTTYSKAAAVEKRLASQEIKGGILERPERILLLFAGILSAAFSTIILLYIIILLAVLSNITALQRMKIAMSKPADQK